MTQRHKLLAVLLASAAATALLLTLGAAHLLRSAVRERYLERLRSETTMLAWQFENDGFSGRDPQAFAEDAASQLGCRVTLIAPTGTVIADSTEGRAGTPGMDNHADRPEVRAALRSGFGEDRRASASTLNPYFYFAARVAGRQDVGIVRLALPARQVERAESGTTVQLIGLAVLASALMGLVGYGAVRRLSKPIEVMTELAERTAAGDLRIEAPERGGEEVRRLAAAHNRMRRNLVSKIEALESERRVLATFVAGVPEPLLLVGGDLRVRLANAAAREVFAARFDPAGRLLAEVVRYPEVIGILEGVLATGQGVSDAVVRLTDSGRSFELQVVAVEGDADAPETRTAIAIFFEVTRLEALERVRQEFVANVGHELRTPLTAIRAAVETLLEGGMDDGEHRERFLRIVERQADHMGALIDDLTDLSRIETGAVALERSETDLAEIAREAVAQARERHPAAAVDVAVEIPAGTVAWIDRRRLVQVLVNLVENAVKFNRPGGHVWVRAAVDDAHTRVEVVDDGIGIPSDGLSKIFNRFYRVDAARSKEVPGTGLGLAIVKHLVRLHGGTVEVRSELGRGSTFVINLPNSRTVAASLLTR